MKFILFLVIGIGLLSIFAAGAATLVSTPAINIIAAGLLWENKSG